jgi:hypothetical protein
LKGLTVNDREVLDPVSNLVQNLVLAHAVWFIVPSKSYDHQTLFLVHDSLIHMPPCPQMGQDHGTHSEMACVVAAEGLISASTAGKYVICFRWVLARRIVETPFWLNGDGSGKESFVRLNI